MMEVNLIFSGDVETIEHDLRCTEVTRGAVQHVISQNQKHTCISGESYDFHVAEHSIKKSLKNKDIVVIFHKFLSGLTNEHHIRRYIGLATGSAGKRCLILEDSENIKIREVVYKSACCLDLQFETTEKEGVTLFELSAMHSGNYPFRVFDSSIDEQAFLSSALGRPVSRISIDGMLEVIENRLREKSGFSFIRFNHCEPRVLGYGSLFYDSDIDITFDIQWGHADISKVQRHFLAGLMVHSMLCADVIGLPTLKRTLESDLNILENSCYVQLRNYRLINDSARFIDVNTHFRLARQQKFFEILANANRLILITGRNVVKKLQKRIGIRDIIVISIPPEAKHSANRAACHFPDAFQGIEDRIKKELLPGDLVLIGAGILGKYYCSLAKENGAVALDIGSLFDAWEGLSTRGKGFPPDLLL